MSDDIPREEVRMALDRVDVVATEHGPDYGAGMRETRLEIERELFQ